MLICVQKSSTLNAYCPHCQDIGSLVVSYLLPDLLDFGLLLDGVLLIADTLLLVCTDFCFLCFSLLEPDPAGIRLHSQWGIWKRLFHEGSRVEETKKGCWGTQGLETAKIHQYPQAHWTTEESPPDRICSQKKLQPLLWLLPSNEEAERNKYSDLSPHLPVSCPWLWLETKGGHWRSASQSSDQRMNLNVYLSLQQLTSSLPLSH